MKKAPKSITLNGTTYYGDSRCPACSGERDTGGRLEMKKRKHYFLKCKKCRYTVKSETTINRQIARYKRMKEKL